MALPPTPPPPAQPPLPNAVCADANARADADMDVNADAVRANADTPRDALQDAVPRPPRADVDMDANAAALPRADVGVDARTDADANVNVDAPRRLVLRRFVRPGAPASPVRALRAAGAALPGGGVRLTFVLAADWAALRWPAPDAPGPLWRHTCFEAFVSAPGQPGYREFNFSPAGPWAAGAFRRYRELARVLAGRLTDDAVGDAVGGAVGDVSRDALSGAARDVLSGAGLDAAGDAARGAALPVLAARRRGGVLRLTAELPRAWLPPGDAWALGLAAVLERADGQLEYWALHHPLAERADFHHPGGWVLRLA